MSDPLSELKREFHAKAKRPADLFLLSASEALDFVRRGRELGLRLAGVESFRVTESGAFQPEQEFSNDVADFPLSDEEFVANTLELIQAGGSRGLFFQVVIE